MIPALLLSFALLVPSFASSGDPAATLLAGSEFVEQYKSSTEFDLNKAKAIAGELRAVGESRSVEMPMRSRAYLVLAGVHGRISDKLRSRGGTAHGKLALQAIHESLRLNPEYKNAATAYGTMILRMLSKNRVTRKFIEMGMGIDLWEEGEQALKALDRAGLKKSAVYVELSSIFMIN